MSTDDELIERVRTLRTQGCTPKQIARTVGVPAARVTALVRAMAAEQAAANPHQLVGCWVSPRWSGGLTVTGHPEWPDVDFDRSDLHGGLANVVVARQERRDRVTVCGYLVDTFCLGLKNTLGPRSMAAGDLDAFVAFYFDAHDEPPLPVGLDLVQHLVFGGIEYARAWDSSRTPTSTWSPGISANGRHPAQSRSAATASPCTSRAHGTTPPRSRPPSTAPSGKATTTTFCGPTLSP
ncbi:hypothetical protein [Actinoplanes subtropicus]|uniref:hypothetical protein n=1 Tax=Actinoplanes subtropicus TaxID=543632 RepID=UPI00068FEF03|nr:hypothetical protein [Actinoplanes subtropicus]